VYGRLRRRQGASKQPGDPQSDASDVARPEYGLAFEKGHRKTFSRHAHMKVHNTGRTTRRLGRPTCYSLMKEQILLITSCYGRLTYLRYVRDAVNSSDHIVPIGKRLTRAIAKF
jgi:hypothetical protein